ncbi:MAG: hypothetical protein K2W82_15610 [Candidatus Obscuribacterales bacterium]|nr:hypothetical protein [Candidatus Obscuribacterales bacterium]
MLYRLEKFAVATAHILLAGIVLLAFFGQMSWSQFLATTLVVTALRQAVTWIRLTQLLKTFEDNLSRMQILLPACVGLAVCVLSLLLLPNLVCKVSATALLAGWAGTLLLYRRRRSEFIRFGHGPLPKDVWLNPPAEAMREGDLILTGGRMAARTHNSVGHVEIVIKGRKGRLMSHTAYMEKGVVMHTARAVVAMEHKLNEHFVVLRLRQPLTAEQSARAIEIAEDMLARNEAWREADTKRRHNFVRKAWFIPARLKAWLLDKDSLCELLKQGEQLAKQQQKPSYWLGFKVWLQRRVWPTGYDWYGQYTGFIHQDRWTCMGVVLETLQRLNVPIRNYGTGMLGLGTGLLNPLLPIRLLSDPCYRLVNLDDKAAFEAVAGTAVAE